MGQTVDGMQTSGGFYVLLVKKEVTHYQYSCQWAVLIPVIFDKKKSGHFILFLCLLHSLVMVSSCVLLNV